MHPIATAVVAAFAVFAPAAAQEPARTARIERIDPALDTLIAADAPIERVATGFGFTEGPLWHDGKLWFSDVVGDKLRTVDRAGKVTELLANSGGLANPPAGASIGSNGLIPDRDGSVLMAQMGARQIVRVDAAGKVTPFLSAYQGKRLNSPNDLVYAPDGALWFTDPPFGLFNGMDKDPKKELPNNPVFRYAGGKLDAVITDLKLPNGIGLSPKGDTLYIADYGQATIFAYKVARDGAVSDRRSFFTFPKGPGGGADGLKVDLRGNVWATGPGGIWIFSPAGKTLGRIHMPETAANLAFGEQGDALWITASTSIYRVPIKGVGALPMFAR
ncbi:SMP-30/gluconolactonase/LRE family protein [Sphingomonas sp. S1-29]|uniref:SMP-30/gluconolactonase/LRE family protein n=1 Tax=Sphingomonas sp. S1-29 TaxID=2991074 RepID=UPI00223FC58C|nr:SMP-30/gluconolactonase/LRE family protein [Sphingomonas sp. S1-29]UZK69653.1 SMP-30/gluconolactonase/LRE family protein [Sphingomonas sp. S1-29]